MLEKTVPVQLTNLSNSSSDWSTLNPILFLNELGIESDTLLYKIGDGIHTWNELPYSKSAINILTAGEGVTIKDNIISLNLSYTIVRRFDNE